MLRIAVVVLALSASSAQAAQVCSGPGDREWTISGRTISTQLRAEKAVGRLTPIDNTRWRVAFVGGSATLKLVGSSYELTFDDGSTTRGTCVSR